MAEGCTGLGPLDNELDLFLSGPAYVLLSERVNNIHLSLTIINRS